MGNYANIYVSYKVNGKCNHHIYTLQTAVCHNVIFSWTDVATTLHIYYILHCYCVLHVDPTLLHISLRNSKLQHLFHILLLYMCQQQICHICKLVYMQGICTNIFATYEVTCNYNHHVYYILCKLQMATLLFAPEQIWPLHYKYMPHCSAVVVYI